MLQRVLFVTGNLKLALSFFEVLFPPKPKMPFGQRNVTSYIHNIYKWRLGSSEEKGLFMQNKTSNI